MQNSIWIGCNPHNFTPGRRNDHPEFIVVHIMAGTLSGSEAWFNDPHSCVSAHSGIGKNGEVHDYVHSADTAYHAGVYNINGAVFKGFKYLPDGRLDNVNSYTLGLEHEGDANHEITEAQYLASAGKIKYWSLKHNIPINEDHIVTHHAIYPGHNCPNGAINIPKLIALALVAEPINPA